MFLIENILDKKFYSKDIKYITMESLILFGLSTGSLTIILSGLNIFIFIFII